MAGRGRPRQGRSRLSEAAEKAASPSEEAFQRGDWREGRRLATDDKQRARFRNDPAVGALFAIAAALFLFCILHYGGR